MNKFLRILTILIIIIGMIMKYFQLEHYDDSFLIIGALLGIYLSTKNNETSK